MATKCLVAIGAACALAAGCADAQSEIEPQVPVNAQLYDHTRMPAPDIVDSFPQAFAMTQSKAPRPWRPRSISLGFIGDGPLGTEATPPHHEPYWARPFPCHWTNTCGLVPLWYVSPYAGVGGRYVVPVAAVPLPEEAPSAPR